MERLTKRKRGGGGKDSILGLMGRLHQALKQGSDVEDEQESAKQQQRLHKIQKAWAHVNKRFVCVGCRRKHDEDDGNDSRDGKCVECFENAADDVEESEDSEDDEDVTGNGKKMKKSKSEKEESRKQRKEHCVKRLEELLPKLENVSVNEEKDAGSTFQSIVANPDVVAQYSAKDCGATLKAMKSTRKVCGKKTLCTYFVDGICYEQVLKLHESQKKTGRSTGAEFLKANHIKKSSFHAQIKFAKMCRVLGWEFVCSWDVKWRWINDHFSVLGEALDEVLPRTKLGAFEDEKEEILKRWRRRKDKGGQHGEDGATDEDDLLDF
jgi:hypothetical protein